MDKLKEKLWKELDEISDKIYEKSNMTAGDLETALKLIEAIKGIDKIYLLEDESGYSSDGEWQADMRGVYGRGSSYGNRGQHYVRAHYSRDGGDDGYSSRRDGRGRYSRDEGRSEMMRHIEKAIDVADEQDRETLKRFMRQLENS